MLIAGFQGISITRGNMTKSDQIEREKTYWTNKSEFEWLSDKRIRDILKHLSPIKG